MLIKCLTAFVIKCKEKIKICTELKVTRERLSSLLELEPSFLPLMRRWGIGGNHFWAFEFNRFGKNRVDVDIWIILEQNKRENYEL